MNLRRMFPREFIAIFGSCQQRDKCWPAKAKAENQRQENEEVYAAATACTCIEWVVQSGSGRR